jgi:hypothetical protein
VNARSVRINALTLFCVIFTGGSLLLAQAPKSAKEIPVYSGSIRDAGRESEVRSQMSWDTDQSLQSAELNLYKAGASAEDVFNFYLQKIGGKEGSPDVDPTALTPGSASQAFYDIEYYSDEEFTDYQIEQDVRHPGTWMKQKLVENRKPYQPGKWIKEARFNWYKKESNGNITMFYVIIADQSFDPAAGNKYKTNTEIQFQVTTGKSGQAMREENEEKMEKRTAELSASLKNKPPTEKDLGVPVYPGAKFDADASAGMSSGNDYAMYVYLSTDEPSKVVGFYEKQLKTKAAEPAKGRYIIPLKGELPVPKEGISIEPNTMFGGSAKTVITIQKMVKNGE